ncbi:transposable element Tcb2 transposase [Trichonephila clavipes]|nr:transposable element Tcb2 transposase [Trichonephila clavipes]
MCYHSYNSSQEPFFQQANARPYTARLSQDYLYTVITLPRPSRSPDLSPVENTWDPLGRQVGHPTSLNELEARLQQLWNEMSQDICDESVRNLSTNLIRRWGI